MNTLHTSAILVSLHISKYDPFVFDRFVSEQVAAEHAATKNAGKYRKSLFPDNCFPALTAILKKLNELYVWHAENTLVWDGRGTRLLPIALAEEHKTRTDSVLAELPAMLDALETGYSAACETAQTKLNGMFKARDYPKSGFELRKRFAVTADYNAVPQEVTGLPASVATLINSGIAERVNTSLDAAMSDAWTRLYTCVEKLHDKLATPGAIFRDTLVGNVREVCDVLTKLNITGNADLETMRAKVAADIAQYDPDTLRDNALLREGVAKTAAGMLDTMRATRKIVRLDDMEASA